MALLTTALFDGDGTVDPDAVSEIIIARKRDEVPLYGYLTAMQLMREVGTEKFEWFSDSLADRGTAINNAPDNYDASTTSIVVDDASVFAPNYLALAAATGEVMLVTAVNTATNTLTVVRGWGDSTAAIASVANNAAINVIGHAAGEGSGVPTFSPKSKSNHYNFVQQIKKAVKLTGRASATVTRTENERSFQRRKALEEAILDIERSLISGERGKATDADGRNVTTTRGVRNAILTNVSNVGGTLSKSELRELSLSHLFTQGSQSKLALCGATAYDAVFSLYESQLRINNNEQGAVGFRPRSILAGTGELQIVPHRLLDAGEMIVVDPAEVELRYFREGRGQLHLQTDIQVPGEDQLVDQYVAELGLQWGNEEAHARLTGITGAAA